MLFRLKREKNLSAQIETKSQLPNSNNERMEEMGLGRHVPENPGEEGVGNRRMLHGVW